jgi:Zn-finger nucleic acid-binding protein
MKCPICTGVDLKIAERQGVEIDYCPECRGVWLDRGELDKILERSTSQIPVSPQPVPQYQEPAYNQSPAYSQQHHGKPHHDDHSYGHNGQYKKKSWLTEIFD